MKTIKMSDIEKSIKYNEYQSMYIWKCSLCGKIGVHENKRDINNIAKNHIKLSHKMEVDING